MDKNRENKIFDLLNKSLKKQKLKLIVNQKDLTWVIVNIEFTP